VIVALWLAAAAHTGWPAGLVLEPDGADWQLTWRVPDALATTLTPTWDAACAVIGPPRRGRDDDLGVQITAWTLRCPDEPALSVTGLQLDEAPVVLRTPAGRRLLAARPPHGCDSTGGTGALAALVALVAPLRRRRLAHGAGQSSSSTSVRPSQSLSTPSSHTSTASVSATHSSSFSCGGGP
jgi:uncharacterized protein (TIGR03382 family)